MIQYTEASDKQLTSQSTNQAAIHATPLHPIPVKSSPVQSGHKLLSKIEKGKNSQVKYESEKKRKEPPK